MIFFLPRRHVAKDGRSRQLLLPLPKTAVTSGPSLGPKKKGQSTFFFRCCCCCCCCSRGGEIKKREKWEILKKNVKKKGIFLSRRNTFFNCQSRRCVDDDNVVGDTCDGICPSASAAEHWASLFPISMCVLLDFKKYIYFLPSFSLWRETRIRGIPLPPRRYFIDCGWCFSFY